MTSQLKLIFFGTEQFSVPTLKALVSSEYNIVAIVTKPDSRKGRGNKLFVHPIKQVGIDNNIPVLQPEKLSDIKNDLLALKPDFAVLVSYGKIIPQSIIDIFEPIGIINIHPSRLPHYRGPSPIESAILAGDSETAVSIMKLDSGMDTGPVFAQLPVYLTGSENKLQLSEMLSKTGAEFLLEILPDILSGKVTPVIQGDNDVSVTSLIHKEDGVLDPTTDNATHLERKVRAYLNYPKTHLNISDNDVVVTSAKVVSDFMENDLIIYCADNSLLKIEGLIAPSGKTMTGRDYLRGYPKVD